MTEYENISFLIPGGFGVLAFLAWADVVRRMTNLHVQILIRLSVMFWATAILAVSTYDILGSHYYASYSEALFAVSLKTVLHLGAAGVALAGNYLLARSYPLRMAASKNEPNPKAVCFVDTSDPRGPLVSTIRDQFVTLIPAR